MKTKGTLYKPSLDNVLAAAKSLIGIAVVTPLLKNQTSSIKYNSNIYFKREDLQQVRSYKIRGAFNKIANLTKSELNNGVVCASAGNHAQGVAFSCNKLSVNGTIFVPETTPLQKLERIKWFGGKHIKLILHGVTFDDANNKAIKHAQMNKKTFIPPFDDKKIIEGQATIALELIRQHKKTIDYLFIPVGGGGLAAGVTEIFKLLSPKTKLIGVEPTGAPSMSASIKEKKVVPLKNINRFVDGAAVKKVGHLNYEICKSNLDNMITVEEKSICKCIIELYNKDAIVAEPAGAMSLAALDKFKSEIIDKNVVCIISGGNNDIERMEEIRFLAKN